MYRPKEVEDGFYNITVKGRVFMVFCEFRKQGKNWVVSVNYEC